MSAPSLSDTLKQLANAQTGRSETSRLRDVFPDVEKALAAGVSRQAVLDALHQDGFSMSFKNFEKALYRIRKQNKAANLVSTSTSNQTSEKDVANTAKSKPHAFAGLAGNGRDKDAVHHSVPDKDRIYDRNNQSN
jgi:hypothetical protein